MPQISNWGRGLRKLAVTFPLNTSWPLVKAECQRVFEKRMERSRQIKATLLKKAVAQEIEDAKLRAARDAEQLIKVAERMEELKRNPPPRPILPEPIEIKEDFMPGLESQLSFNPENFKDI